MTLPSKDSPLEPPRRPSTAVDEKLFHSDHVRKLKQEICEMGRRLWMREYCDGNGGNISCRLSADRFQLSADRFLVTPTGVSKGFMTTEMLCLVDSNGSQILPAEKEKGAWKRSSEFTTHLAIYQNVPEAAAVCHAHPCHVGAFAIKEIAPPSCLTPEMEVFVGCVPVAPYETPGSEKLATALSPLAPKHQSVILGLHGLICWGYSIEDAYFKVEITDAYCRTVLLARSLPGSAAISPDKLKELLDLKKKLGLPDSRLDLAAHTANS